LDGASVLIALLITLTISYLVIAVKAEVPGILANALTMLMGLLFGNEVTKKKG